MVPTTRCRKLRLATLFSLTASLIWLTGCSTARHARQLDIDRLLAEKGQLDQLETALRAGEYPPTEYDAHLFVSNRFINSYLAGYDELELPQTDEITVFLDSGRLVARDGYPQIDLKARAVHHKWGLEAALSVRAVIEPVPVPDEQKIRLNLHVEDVVPILRWRCWQWRVWWFARQLLKAELSSAIDKSLEKRPLELPLEPLVVEIPGDDEFPKRDRIQIGDAEPMMRFDLRGRMKWEKSWDLVATTHAFQTDGVHLYLEVVR